MGRTPCCAKVGLNRGAWTALEDKILADYIQVHGEGRWKQLPKNAGLKRCGKSCRLRWLNYLRPDIKRGNISGDEEELIVRLHKLLGNRWSLIAGRIPGRTDNEIKNYWNTNLSKKAASTSSLNRSSQIIKPKNTTTTTNNNNAMTSTTIGPNSSPPVFRTRATRISKVVVQQPQPPTLASTANVVTSYEEFGEHSLFNFNEYLTVEGGSNAEFDDIDDLSLGDFCLSDFLSNDQFDIQGIINTDNEKDCDFSEAVNPLAQDGHEYRGQMRQSTTNVASDMNPQPLFIDPYDDNWDL